MSEKLLKNVIEGNVSDFREEFKKKMQENLNEKLVKINKELFKESKCLKEQDEEVEDEEEMDDEDVEEIEDENEMEEGKCKKRK